MSAASAPVGSRKRGFSLGRLLIYVFCTVTALLWLVPLIGPVCLVAAVIGDDSTGLLSRPDTITLDNYRNAWDRATSRTTTGIPRILVPALIVTLFFSSMVAFVCSRYSWQFNIFMLSLFTAGNLLPQQIIIQPLFQFYNRVPCRLDVELRQAERQHLGIILIHIAFQSGFCTFVLSNYMKLLPKSLTRRRASTAPGSGSSTGRSSCR